MRHFRFVLLGIFATLGTFLVVSYSSCSKDSCKDITCLHKTKCNAGLCVCPPGIDGANCEIVYRERYASQYVGLSPIDTMADTTNTLVFSTTSDTTDYNNMDVTWLNDSGSTIVNMALKLSNNQASGSSFTIQPTTSDIYTFTGNGTINGNLVTMLLNRRDTAGVVVTYNFLNYIKH